MIINLHTLMKMPVYVNVFQVPHDATVSDLMDIYDWVKSQCERYAPDRNLNDVTATINLDEVSLYIYYRDFPMLTVKRGWWVIQSQDGDVNSLPPERCESEFRRPFYENAEI